MIHSLSRLAACRDARPTFAAPPRSPFPAYSAVRKGRDETLLGMMGSGMAVTRAGNSAR